MEVPVCKGLGAPLRKDLGGGSQHMKVDEGYSKDIRFPELTFAGTQSSRRDRY
jgi:hypothetical protein